MGNSFKCPKCKEQYDSLQGQNPKEKFKCKRCGKLLQIPNIRGRESKIEDEMVAFLTSSDQTTQSANQIRYGAESEQIEDNTAGQSTTKICPNCSRVLPKADVLCIKCGFDYRSGEALNTRTAAQVASQALASIGFGKSKDVQNDQAGVANHRNLRNYDSVDSGKMLNVHFDLLCDTGQTSVTNRRAETVITRSYKVSKHCLPIPPSGVSQHNLRCEFCKQELPIGVISSEVLGKEILRAALLSLVLYVVLIGFLWWMRWTQWYLSIIPMILWFLLNNYLMRGGRVALLEHDVRNYYASSQSANPGKEIEIKKHVVVPEEIEDDKLGDNIIRGLVLVVALTTSWILSYF